MTDLHTDTDLRAWDWRAALLADERSVAWLARKTSTPVRTVYAYAYGQRGTSLEWLRRAAAVLRPAETETELRAAWGDR